MPAISVQLNTFIAPAGRPSEVPVGTAGASGLFARVLHAFEAARQRQVDREISRLIQAGGGRLTDSLERRIERHLA